jgi:hypothetical protein
VIYVGRSFIWYPQKSRDFFRYNLPEKIDFRFSGGIKKDAEIISILINRQENASFFHYCMFISISGRIRNRRIRRLRSSRAAVSVTGIRIRRLRSRRTRLRSYRANRIHRIRLRSSKAAAVSKYMSCCLLQRNRPYQNPLSSFIIYYMTIQEYWLQIILRLFFCGLQHFLGV